MNRMMKKTFYLPKQLDLQLKLVTSESDDNESEILRDLIAEGLMARLKDPTPRQRKKIFEYLKRSQKCACAACGKKTSVFLVVNRDRDLLNNLLGNLELFCKDCFGLFQKGRL